MNPQEDLDRLADEAARKFIDRLPSQSAEGFRLGWLEGFKAASPSEDPLESPLMLRQRLEQGATNFYWLLARVDAAHAALCGEKLGTWQQRADQLVVTARSIEAQLREITELQKTIAGVQEIKALLASEPGPAEKEAIHAQVRALEAKLVHLTPEQKAALSQQIVEKLKV